MATFSVRLGFILLLAMGIGLCRADQERRLPTIGPIYFTNPTLAKPVDDAFRDGLLAPGYVDGKNISIVPLYAQGQEERVPALVKQPISLHVDVMVVSVKAVRAATQATKTIPIVCPYIGDPVKAGLVVSLAHPGGNFTGISGQNWETDSKRLQLGKEVLPGLKRVAVLYDANLPDDVTSAEQLRDLARGQAIIVHLLGAHTPEEIRRELTRTKQSGDQLLIVFATPFTDLNQKVIMNLVAHRLPVITDGKNWADAGALITYAANGPELYRRSATYIDKILKGANPADLPIEQASRFELVVNLRAARDLGMKVPDSVVPRGRSYPMIFST